jgi:transposase
LVPEADMDPESRETWAKRVERWKESGLTAKEFAAEMGINAHSLTWWKWRLSSSAGSPRADASAHGTSRRGRSASPTVVTPLTFVEMPAGVAAESLEVVLPSSVRIRVPPAFDARALGRLLEVLDARR